MYCNVLQCIAVYCGVLQGVIVRCSVLQCCGVYYSGYSTLQCVAVCCSDCVPKMQHRYAGLRRWVYFAMRCTVLQYVAVCCSALQCVAVCCSALQCVAVGVYLKRNMDVQDSGGGCVAVCCNVLRCVAVCCGVLQCART